MTSERDYRAALRDQDYARILQTYAELPYQERTVFNSKKERVRVGQRCPWYDRIFSLLPWEGFRGAWRIGRSGRPIFYAYDDYGSYLPEATEEDREVIARLEILWW